ncbi:MAG TPA: hypothetical protein VF933_29885 [Streptosporangiaceae bacterium]
MRLTVTSHLTLDEVMQSNAVVAHIYQPSGKPEYGSAAPEHDGDAVKDPMSRPAGPIINDR